MLLGVGPGLPWISLGIGARVRPAHVALALGRSAGSLAGGRSVGGVVGGRSAGDVVGGRSDGGVVTDRSAGGMALGRQAGGPEKVVGGVVRTGLLIVGLILDTRKIIILKTSILTARYGVMVK